MSEEKITKLDCEFSFEELPKRKRLLGPQKSQKVAYGMLTSSAVFIVAILGLFLGLIFVNGFRYFNFRLIFSSFDPAPGVEQYGLLPAIFGTFMLIAGAILIAVPIGLLSAIYLTEYTKGGIIVAIIDQSINNLAGVPSVVIGLFGYAFFSVFLGLGSSMIAAWLTLACLLLPTIIRTSQEALRSVPKEYREGSFALGINKWKTIRHVVLPSALPGISTGVILSLGRAAGETAAVVFVGAGVFLNKIFGGFTGTFMTLPNTILVLYRSVGGWNKAGDEMWFATMILMFIVLFFNGIAIIIRNRSEKKRA